MEQAGQDNGIKKDVIEVIVLLRHDHGDGNANSDRNSHAVVIISVNCVLCSKDRHASATERSRLSRIMHIILLYQLYFILL